MTFQTPEPFAVPEGGLATFLTATKGSWAEDSSPVPAGGISNISHAADQLAQFGRNGDTYMVHAAEGETFVPKEVLDANPGLKESLFSQMRSMGIENPERYIVGSDLNSLNPVTGQPEFFLSKIFKSVKNAVKGVVKVVKKVAPIILPFAIDAFLPGLGTVASGALGAGLGTLIQGGDMGDALKSAAFGGLTAGAMQGIRNTMAGKSFFGEMLPGKDPLRIEKKNWITDMFSPKSAVESPINGLKTQTIVNTAPRGPKVKEIDLTKLPVRALKTQAPPVKPTFQQVYDQLKNPPSILDYLKKGEYSKALFGETNTLADLMGKFPGLEDKQYKALLTTNPGIVRKYGPSVALGLGATAAFGGFDRPVPPKVKSMAEKATERYEEDPERYSLLPQNFTYFGPRRGTPRYAYAAAGGEMYPERIGAIAGPGTGVSDDVPALLSDGEFVMTARAVRGAGNGSRRKGVRRMYELMRRFEGGAV
jgi:hypothetical protein